LQKGILPGHGRYGEIRSFNSLIKLTKWQAGRAPSTTRAAGSLAGPGSATLDGMPQQCGPVLANALRPGKARGTGGLGPGGQLPAASHPPKPLPGQITSLGIPVDQQAFLKWHEETQPSDGRVPFGTSGSSRRSRCFVLGPGQFVSGCGCGRGSSGKDGFHPKCLQQPFLPTAPLSMRGGLRPHPHRARAKPAQSWISAPAHLFPSLSPLLCAQRTPFPPTQIFHPSSL